MSLTPAECRVAEFLRQWEKVNAYTDDIYGVNFDGKIDYMAHLWASDLREIIESRAGKP